MAVKTLWSEAEFDTLEREERKKYELSAGAGGGSGVALE